MLRTSLVALAATVAAVATTAPAAALTASPTGTYKEAGSQPIFQTTSTRQSWACTLTSSSFTLAADGTATYASGAGTFTGCNNTIFGPINPAQATAWSSAFTLAPSGSDTLVTQTITVPTGGLVWNYTAGCRPTFNGTITRTRLESGSAPVTISPVEQLTQTAALTADNVSGCPALLITLGLRITFNSPYSFSRALTLG